MPDNVTKKEMTLGDFTVAFILAVFSRHPFVNLWAVLRHPREDFGPGPWIQMEAAPDRYTPVAMVAHKPGVIYYSGRWGVYVAYMSEDLAELDRQFLMLQPRPGMAIFAEHGSRVPKKTGNRRDLDELARITGRTLELVSEHAFFMPFTSSTDAELDLQKFGHLILDREEAAARWVIPESERSVAEK